MPEWFVVLSVCASVAALILAIVAGARVTELKSETAVSIEGLWRRLRAIPPPSSDDGAESEADREKRTIVERKIARLRADFEALRAEFDRRLVTADQVAAPKEWVLPKSTVEALDVLRAYVDRRQSDADDPEPLTDEDVERQIATLAEKIERIDAWGFMIQDQIAALKTARSDPAAVSRFESIETRLSDAETQAIGRAKRDVELREALIGRIERIEARIENSISPSADLALLNRILGLEKSIASISSIAAAAQAGVEAIERMPRGSYAYGERLAAVERAVASASSVASAAQSGVEAIERGRDVRIESLREASNIHGRKLEEIERRLREPERDPEDGPLLSADERFTIARQRIDGLAARVAEIEKVGSADLRKQLDGFSMATGQRLARIRTRLDKLEAALEAKPVETDEPAEIEKFSGRLARLDDQVRTLFQARLEDISWKGYVNRKITRIEADVLSNRS